MGRTEGHTIIASRCGGDIRQCQPGPSGLGPVAGAGAQAPQPEGCGLRIGTCVQDAALSLRQDKTIQARKSIVAGRFYPASRRECAAQLDECIPAQLDSPAPDAELYGAVVPHAGWVCSGGITGQTLKALADRTDPETVVLIGAVHSVPGRRAALYDRGAWETPLGEIAVDETLADLIVEGEGDIDRDREMHHAEHSLEVQVPFIQRLFPNAKLLPIMVPPSDVSGRIGGSIGRKIAAAAVRVIIVGTSDLTHYGPSYGMTSQGAGQEGLDWAKNVNDRSMIDRILAMDSEGIVSEAAQHRNACGSGAIAATIAACQALGAREAVLLEHRTSQETLRGMLPEPVADTVGYAGIVFCS